MLIFVKVSFGEFYKFLDYFIFICRLLYPLKILNANFWGITNTYCVDQVSYNTIANLQASSFSLP